MGIHLLFQKAATASK